MAKFGFRFLLIIIVLGLAIISCRIPGIDKAKTILTGLPAIATEMATKMPDMETLTPEQTIMPLITTFPELLPKASSGDQVTAWASQSNTTEEWLELGYAVPLYVTEITIYQSYNPTQITKVELIEPNGTAHEVFSDVPQDKGENCPYKTVISWENPLNYPTENVRISVDQSVLGLGWAEIDAVELTGIQVENLYADDGGAGSISRNDDLPVPPGAVIILSTIDSINYNISMSLDEVMQYYRQEFAKIGLKENTTLTVEFKGGFSMVFDDPKKGKTVLQATELASGKVVVTIRHE